MEKKKIFTRKRVTGIMSALLIVALLLGGTFAFVDFDQHKTNFAKGGENVSVTLNDSYKPPADWKKGQTLDKKVSVTNTAGGSDPIFVRVQFKEYFEMSKLKLVTDGAGKGLLFATYADGVQKGEFMTWADAHAGGYDYVKHTVTYADGSKKDFALTQNAELRNGIYGKEMYIPSDLKIFGDAVKANYPTQPHETQSDTNLECQYPTHIWDTCGIKADDNDEIHNYISWNLGEEVMTMAAWITAGKTIGDFWVLDTTDGWAYWANPLQPGESTKNIMESIKLDNMPGNFFEYYIHIDMEALTLDELTRTDGDKKWTDVSSSGQKLIDKWTKGDALPGIPEGFVEVTSVEPEAALPRVTIGGKTYALIITKDAIKKSSATNDWVKVKFGYDSGPNVTLHGSSLVALQAAIDDWLDGTGCETCPEDVKTAAVGATFDPDKYITSPGASNSDANSTGVSAPNPGGPKEAFALSATEAYKWANINNRSPNIIRAASTHSWLRSGAESGTTYAWALYSSGELFTSSYRSTNYALRPALWVEITNP